MPNQRKIDVATAQARYEARSTKASDVSRQLAFAGVAIAWLFSGATKLLSPHVQIPSGLLSAGLIFVIALAFDLLQYVGATLFWGLYSRIKELQVMAKHVGEPFISPRWLNWPALWFFVLKLIALVVGYAVLADALAHRIN
jgi:hypothetical protein